MDYPIEEIRRRADEALANFPNANVFFKWTCEICGSRQTFDTPNTIFASGTCEECFHETKLDRYGFDLVVSLGPKP